MTFSLDSAHDHRKAIQEIAYLSIACTAKNERIANMLLSAFAGGGKAELTAITQYLNHSDTISEKDISDMIFCIALAEMQHLDLVGTLSVMRNCSGILNVWTAQGLNRWKK